MSIHNKPSTNYEARLPDEQGVIHYHDDEHLVWQELYARQADSIVGKAHHAYLEGLDTLNLPKQHIPHLPDVDKVLQKTTGWQTEAVPALIGFGRFFELLANKRFPVATFIRHRDDFDYIKEPDIFHEIVGHCPLLTHQGFADFTHRYGQLGHRLDASVRVFLARLYWFTMEFGLIRTTHGLQIYGGGILSSPNETHYALSGVPEYREFKLLDILRTPYRIDRVQPIYYVLEEPQTLFDITTDTLLRAIDTAKQKGLFAPHPALA